MNDPTETQRRLSSGRAVAVGTLWNAVGRIGPLLIAVMATPALVHSLGLARWGVFTLALSMVGIFGIFDFGIGRAITRCVADAIGAGRPDDAADAAWTGIVIITLLGVGGGVGMAACAHWLAYSVLSVPPELREQVVYALYVLSLSVPLVILNAALWGIMAAFQRFQAANLINIPIMAFYYIGPLLVLMVSDTLPAVIAVLVGCRVVMTISYWILAFRAMPSLRGASFRLAAVRPVLSLGGWMMVSNLVGPMLLYLDRFILASLMSVVAAAYFSTPYDLVVRIWVIPIAIMNTAFPALTASLRGNPQGAGTLFRRCGLSILALVFVPCVIATAFGPWLLRQWLGADFAEHAGNVLQILSVGVLFTCVAQLPAGLVDGVGRPDLNAKLSFVEVLVYVPCFVALISAFGIQGAALAWATRVGLDCLARLVIAARCYEPGRAAIHTVMLSCAIAGLLLVLPLAVPYGIERVGAVGVVLACLAATLWRIGLSEEERGASFGHLLRLSRWSPLSRRAS